MTVEEHQQDLKECYASPNNSLSNAAQAVNYYTELVKQGQLSREEYADLLEDIKRQTEIENAMGDFELKQKVHTAINGLIAIAKLV